jgi:TolA-binding protein
MENFFTVNLGNVLTIVSFLGGGLAFVYTIRNDVQLQAQRMDFMQEANAQRLSSLEIEIRTLRDVLVDLAKQATRLDMLEQQLMELRREKH